MQDVGFRFQGLESTLGYRVYTAERDRVCVENLLVRIHFIIEMIW